MSEAIKKSNEAWASKKSIVRKKTSARHPWTLDIRKAKRHIKIKRVWSDGQKMDPSDAHG